MNAPVVPDAPFLRVVVAVRVIPNPVPGSPTHTVFVWVGVVVAHFASEGEASAFAFERFEQRHRALGGVAC